MIYPTQARAQEVADMLNRHPGSLESRAVATPHGWTVITRSWWPVPVDANEAWLSDSNIRAIQAT